MKCNNQRNLDISMAKVIGVITCEFIPILLGFLYFINFNPQKVDKCILTQISKALSLHVMCNIRIIFLLKGIWATTLANEKKLNRAFKVRLCDEFCSD